MIVVRPLLAAAKMLLVLTVILGLAYPLMATAAARVLPNQADGSQLSHRGVTVGSSLLGQHVTDPGLFHSRPSVSDASGTTSGGSNLAASSEALRKAVTEREATLRAANPQASGPIPADALTASASGLDPHISPAYAAWQAPRVAASTRLPLADVETLIAQHTSRAALGFIGNDTVNVPQLNQALLSKLGR